MTMLTDPNGGKTLPVGLMNLMKAQNAAAQYGQFWGEKCAWVYMAHQAGVGTEDPKDFDAARQAIEATFPEEVAFLRAMPTILLNDRYLFVHGGVPREDRLEDLTARACMKNDDFLNQGHAFQRWVIVGHWPVTLYRKDIPSAKPLVLPDRHIVSIDGGCNLKADGQLNALILPKEPGEDFAWLASRRLPGDGGSGGPGPLPQPHQHPLGPQRPGGPLPGGGVLPLPPPGERAGAGHPHRLPPPGPGRALLPGLHRLSAARPGGGPAGHRPPH